MSNPADGAFRALDEDLMRAVLRMLAVCPGWVVMSGVSHVWRNLVLSTPCRNLTIPRRPAGRISLRQLRMFLNSWPAFTGRSTIPSSASSSSSSSSSYYSPGPPLRSLDLSKLTDFPAQGWVSLLDGVAQGLTDLYLPDVHRTDLEILVGDHRRFPQLRVIDVTDAQSLSGPVASFDTRFPPRPSLLPLPPPGSASSSSSSSSSAPYQETPIQQWRRESAAIAAGPGLRALCLNNAKNCRNSTLRPLLLRAGSTLECVHVTGAAHVDSNILTALYRPTKSSQCGTRHPPQLRELIFAQCGHVYRDHIRCVLLFCGRARLSFLNLSWSKGVGSPEGVASGGGWFAANATGVPIFPHLRTVVLDKCKGLTDRSLRGLTRRCHKLSELSVRGCSQISDASLRPLVDREAAMADIRDLLSDDDDDDDDNVGDGSSGSFVEVYGAAPSTGTASGGSGRRLGGSTVAVDVEVEEEDEDGSDHHEDADHEDDYSNCFWFKGGAGKRHLERMAVSMQAHLQKLDLSHTRVSEEVVALAELTLPRLRSLQLDGCRGVPRDMRRRVRESQRLSGTDGPRESLFAYIHDDVVFNRPSPGSATKKRRRKKQTKPLLPNSWQGTSAKAGKLQAAVMSAIDQTLRRRGSGRRGVAPRMLEGGATAVGPAEIDAMIEWTPSMDGEPASGRASKAKNKKKAGGSGEKTPSVASTAAAGAAAVSAAGANRTLGAAATSAPGANRATSNPAVPEWPSARKRQRKH